MASPVHSFSTGFTLRNRKKHSSCLVIARNLPPSSRGESYLVLPLHAKSEKSIVTVLAGSLRKLLPLSANSWSPHKHYPHKLGRNSYFSTATNDISEKWSTLENDNYRVVFEGAKYLWLWELMCSEVLSNPRAHDLKCHGLNLEALCRGAR